MEKQIADIASWPAAFPAMVTVLVLVTLTFIMVTVLAVLARVTHDLPAATRAVLTILVTLAFVGAIFLTMVRTIPENEGAGLLLGGLIAGFSNVVTHYFSNQKRDSEGPPQ